jgi:hypothetical protein
MKSKLCLLLILLTTCAVAQVVLVDEKNKVVLSVKSERSKGRIERTLKWVDPRVSRTFTSSFKEDGELVTVSLATVSNESVKEIRAQVTPVGAEVFSGGRTAEIPRFDKLSVRDPSVTWFVERQPAKGETAEFMSFDPERRYWEAVTVSYEGEGKLGDSATGHLVTRKTSRGQVRMLLDSKGEPLVWEEGRLRLVRR